jgi:hypothetical protein
MMECERDGAERQTETETETETDGIVDAPGSCSGGVSLLGIH